MSGIERVTQAEDTMRRSVSEHNPGLMQQVNADMRSMTQIQREYLAADVQAQQYLPSLAIQRVDSGIASADRNNDGRLTKAEIVQDARQPNTPYSEQLTMRGLYQAVGNGEALDRDQIVDRLHSEQKGAGYAQALAEFPGLSKMMQADGLTTDGDITSTAINRLLTDNASHQFLTSGQQSALEFIKSNMGELDTSFVNRNNWFFNTFTPSISAERMTNIAEKHGVDTKAVAENSTHRDQLRTALEIEDERTPQPERTYPERIRPEDGHTTRDEVQGRKNEEQATRNENQARLNEELSRRNEEEARRNEEQAKRNQDLARRNEEQARHNEELARRNENAARHNDGPQDHGHSGSRPSTYEVKSGENLWTIARHMLTNEQGQRPSNKDVLNLVTDIARSNHLPNPNRIRPGQIFHVPQLQGDW